MKPQVLTTLALRVVAVYIALQAFVYLAQVALFLAFPPASGLSMPVTFLVTLWLVGLFIVALVIWWGAPSLARLASCVVTNDPIELVNTQALVGATFVAAGTLIFIIALPGLVGNVLRAFEPLRTFAMPMLVGSVLQCVLGIGLVVGSGAASRLLLRLRYAGTRVPDLQLFR